MYCKKCGARINDLAEFCTNCGEKITDKNDPDMNNITSKCICPECGAKNDLNSWDCIQCKKSIDKAKLTFKCPDCGSIMKNGYTKCPVCDFDFRTGRKGQHEEFVYIGASSREYEGANTYQKSKIHSINHVPIVVFASVAVIALTIVSCKLFFENRAAQDLYNMAYTAVYDTDMTYVSQRTEQLVNSAYEQAQSIFVLSDTKNRIEELKQISDDYLKLAEAEQLMSDNPIDNFSSIQSRINNINSPDVKMSDRYKYIEPLIENIKFQVNNRSWAEKKLVELQETKIDTIKSWSKSHVINYYSGLVYFVDKNEQTGLEIRLDDYNGNSHYLRLAYNYEEGNTWDKHIGEISQQLLSGKRCVMAAITANDYSDYEQVFTYSYKFE